MSVQGLGFGGGFCALPSLGSPHSPSLGSGNSQEQVWPWGSAGKHRGDVQECEFGLTLALLGVWGLPGHRKERERDFFKVLKHFYFSVHLPAV